MKITYNVEGKDRKELANAIGKLLGMEPIYRKAPTFAYDIGGYVVDKAGVLTTPEEASEDDAFRLVDGLFAEYGYRSEEPVHELFPEEEEALEEAAEEPEAEAAEDEATDEAEDDENCDAAEAENEVTADDGESFVELPRYSAVLPTGVTEDEIETYATLVAQIGNSQEAPETPEFAQEEPEAEPGEEAEEAPEAAQEAPDTADHADGDAEDVDEPADETDDAKGSEEADEAEAAGESADDVTRLTLSLPREKFSHEALERLKAIVASKQTILKKVFETEDLTIIVNDSQILFPWFTLHGVDGEVDAYGKFIFAIARRALTASRISPYEKPTDNEKFTMRLFLNSLGFQGEEFKFARRFLIRNLEGNGAWRYGSGPNSRGVDLEPPTVFVAKPAMTGPEVETLKEDSDDE